MGFVSRCCLYRETETTAAGHAANARGAPSLADTVPVTATVQ
jgi:hypothetical protein